VALDVQTGMPKENYTNVGKYMKPNKSVYAKDFCAGWESRKVPEILRFSTIPARFARLGFCLLTK
jgi:hypothetical protein